MGLSGSGKTSLAKILTPMFNAVWLNADKIREEVNDWDFSEQGRLKQSIRMKIFAVNWHDMSEPCLVKTGIHLTTYRSGRLLLNEVKYFPSLLYQLMPLLHCLRDIL